MEIYTGKIMPAEGSLTSQLCQCSEDISNLLRKCQGLQDGVSARVVNCCFYAFEWTDSTETGLSLIPGEQLLGTSHAVM